MKWEEREKRILARLSLKGISINKKERKNLRKALKFIEKNGYLILTCSNCYTKFSCSGHCLDSAKEMIHFLSEKTCICGNCDSSKETASEWYHKCQKDFPYAWIEREGRKGFIAEKKIKEEKS